MTIKEAKTIEIVGYLSVIGKEPAKTKGVNYWYHSPFREETEPSFKVNRRRNEWYDFGIGKGGNLLDFILLHENISIPEALKKLERCSHLNKHAITDLPPDTSGIEILSIHVVSSPALIRYYQSRRIAVEIADHYLQEVRYRNSNKTYYALGFKNDAEGYELRSPYFKGSSHPKSPTRIQNNSSALAVFEGFFDFLSYLTFQQNQPAPLQDYLVLNSTSFFEKLLPVMQSFQQVHLYLDNDNTGSKCTEMVLKKSKEKFIDERSLYAGYKDLSDWHQHIGTAQNRRPDGREAAYRS